MLFYMRVAFIGHRKIAETGELKRELTGIVESLIVNEYADTFLFGSKSDFNGLSYEVVSEQKEKADNKRTKIKTPLQS